MLKCSRPGWPAARAAALVCGVALLGPSACQQLPYVPEPVGHRLPLPDDAFDICLALMRDRERRIAIADREAFLLQSAWLPCQTGEHPGHRRATVFRDDAGQLQVVVEVRYLGVSRDGLPEASPVRGDRRAEAALAGVLERALAGSLPTPR
jgi:hypothetical protein